MLCYVTMHTYDQMLQNKSNNPHKTCTVFFVDKLFAATYMTSYHVFDSRLEVAKKGFGLVSLDLAVLDGLPSQEVVHLDSKDGRRAALILGAEITCARGTTDVLHVSAAPSFVSAVILYIYHDNHILCLTNSHSEDSVSQGINMLEQQWVSPHWTH